MATHIGMAAFPAIGCSHRSSARAPHATRFWCRSIRSSGWGHRRQRDILNRLNEISFNSSLEKELYGIAMFQRLLADEGGLEDVSWVEQWANMRIHRIANPMTTNLGASSKVNAEWKFLSMLREDGRNCADAFLRDHGQDLGVRSTNDPNTLLDTC
jgi:NTE family protein